jgi:hypothetical protein
MYATRPPDVLALTPRHQAVRDGTVHSDLRREKEREKEKKLFDDDDEKKKRE